MSDLSALRTKTRRLIYEEDAANSHYSDEELDDYLNTAIEYLATEMEWPLQVSTATSVLDQALYTSPTDFIALVEAYFDNLPLTVVDRSDLKAIASNWQDAPSGTPRYLYKADNATFGLWPAPDANSAGSTIQIQYINTPETLSDDADIPDLHSAFQICLPFYAAFMAETKLSNDQKAELQYKRYEIHRNNLKSKVQGFSDELKRFRWV